MADPAILTEWPLRGGRYSNSYVRSHSRLPSAPRFPPRPANCNALHTSDRCASPSPAHASVTTFRGEDDGPAAHGDSP